MRSIILSLLSRDHGRALTDSVRFPGGHQHLCHPLDNATGMMLRFRDWDPEYAGNGEDLERVALLLDGNKLPDIGLKPSVHPAERCYRIPRLVVFRESPVGYRMRIVCVAMPASQSDAFEAELVAVKQYLTAGCIIGTLTSIAMGRRENENPPLTYLWDPNPFAARTEHTDIFVFLQVNHDDRPGHRDRRSCWLRLKRHYIIEDIIREDEPSDRKFTSFADLWPLFEQLSLVPSR